MKVKMQAPEGLCSVSIEGVEVELDEDGCVEAQGTHIDTLKAHGFVEAPKPKAKAVDEEDESEERTSRPRPAKKVKQ